MAVAPVSLRLVVEGTDFRPFDNAVHAAAGRMEAEFSAAAARVVRALGRSGVLDVLAGTPGSPAHAAVAGAVTMIGRQARRGRLERSRDPSAVPGDQDAAGPVRNLSSMTWAFSGVSSGASAAASGVEKVYRTVSSLAGAVFIVERLGRAFNIWVVEPLRGLLENLVEATEQSRSSRRHCPASWGWPRPGS